MASGVVDFEKIDAIIASLVEAGNLEHAAHVRRVVKNSSYWAPEEHARRARAECSALVVVRGVAPKVADELLAALLA